MNFRIEHLDKVSSTNSLVIERALQGENEGLVIVADHQTHGRGKQGNVWISESGQNLLFSILTRPKEKAHQIPIYTQLACRAIAHVLGQNYKILSTFKRPNDILVDGKKICGVLVESASLSTGQVQYMVIGIGLNVNHAPKSHGFKAICMRDILGHEINRKQLLEEILREFELKLGN